MEGIRERQLLMFSDGVERMDGRELSAMFLSSPVGIVETDAHGCVKHWNPAAEKLTGWKADEVVGKQSPVMYPDESSFQELVHRLLTDRVVNGFRLPVQVRGGQHAVHVVSAVAIFDENEQVERVIAFSEDVTETQRVEERLQLMEAALRNACDGIVIVNFDEETGNTTTEFANKAFLDLSGYRLDELVGKTAAEFVHEETDAAVLERVLSELPRGKSVKVESGIRRKDGAMAWVESTLVPLIAGPRKSKYCVAVVRDIRERREIERALKSSEARFRSLVQNTADVISLADASGSILYQSPSVARVLGYEPEEMLGRTMFDYIHADDLEKIKEVFVRLVEAPASQTGLQNMRIKQKDGSWVWVEAVGTNLLNDPNVEALVINWRDVTELRNMQEQLFFSERLAALGTLSAGIAHEINNPLAYVLSNLEYVTKKSAEVLSAVKAGRNVTESELEEMGSAIADAQDGADRVRKTVRDLRAFSRPEQANNGAVDVLTVLENTLNIAWNEIRHRARLRREYQSVPNVLGDASKLGQVFLNLIVNAAQAVPVGVIDANEIVIATGTDNDGNVFVEVSDTGPGISSENLGKIFNPFFTTKPVGQGTGLGLSICHGLMKTMGGEIQVRNNADRGATFRVLLPQSPSPLQTKERKNVPPAKGMNVLVVDDEEMVTKALRRILEEDMTVHSVTSADKALACLAGDLAYDLILCDLLMPEMGGIELYEKLLKENPAAAKRMIFMTGGAFTAHSRTFLERLTTPYLEKPFTKTKLNEVIRQAFTCQ